MDIYRAGNPKAETLCLQMKKQHELLITQPMVRRCQLLPPVIHPLLSQKWEVHRGILFHLWEGAEIGYGGSRGKQYILGCWVSSQVLGAPRHQGGLRPWNEGIRPPSGFRSTSPRKTACILGVLREAELSRDLW